MDPARDISHFCALKIIEIIDKILLGHTASTESFFFLRPCCITFFFSSPAARETDDSPSSGLLFGDAAVNFHQYTQVPPVGFWVPI